MECSRNSYWDHALEYLSMYYCNCKQWSLQWNNHLALYLYMKISKNLNLFWRKFYRDAPFLTFYNSIIWFTILSFIKSAIFYKIYLFFVSSNKSLSFKLFSLKFGFSSWFEFRILKSSSGSLWDRTLNGPVVNVYGPYGNEKILIIR